MYSEESYLLNRAHTWLVEVSGDVVDPAVEGVAVGHELVHPLGVEVADAGPDHHLVRVEVLQLPVVLGRHLRRDVALLRHVRLVVRQELVDPVLQRRVLVVLLTIAAPVAWVACQRNVFFVSIYRATILDGKDLG